MPIRDDLRAPARRAEAPTGLTAPPPETDGGYLCVLASGSSGNCSVLALRRGGAVRFMLIDLGLSPRRTLGMLAGMGLGLHQLDAALVTHLDHDHLHDGWRRQMPGHVRVLMHDRHARHLRVHDRDRWRLHPFDGGAALAPDEDVLVHPLALKHDELGVTSFRIDCSGPLGAASLGFATDVGRVPVELLDLFGASEDGRRSAVDVLAIESNYCPAMQRASSRPPELKQRIMGGHGHLSNQEALTAILQIEPREHVVLLHLSQECNDPDIVAALHSGADYALTITSQHQPCRWVRIGRPAPSPRPARPAEPAATLHPPHLAATLFETAAPAEPVGPETVRHECCC